MVEEIPDFFRDELRPSGRYQESVAGTGNYFPGTSDIGSDDRFAAESGFGDGSRQSFGIARVHDDIRGFQDTEGFFEGEVSEENHLVFEAVFRSHFLEMHFFRTAADDEGDDVRSLESGEGGDEIACSFAVDQSSDKGDDSFPSVCLGRFLIGVALFDDLGFGSPVDDHSILSGKFLHERSGCLRIGDDSVGESKDHPSEYVIVAFPEECFDTAVEARVVRSVLDMDQRNASYFRVCEREERGGEETRPRDDDIRSFFAE